ncbi:hypothetical protein NE865_10232 [Phthorimaea operculella]|nr:hypothetical protein NE865_14150 [Phthorimaea operculella]KAI5637051.1 hypothetical protein NE865_10232 [Phthorimaea operculella]
MECPKCNKTISKSGSHFQCQGCHEKYHRGCVKGLLADQRAGIDHIYCNECEQDFVDPTLTQKPEAKQQDLEKILRDIQKKVNGIPSLKSQLDAINVSMGMLSDKYDTLVTEQEQSKKNIKDINKNITNINNKIVYLEKCNAAMEQKLQEHEQASRQHNLQIVGIEQLPGEQLRDLVSKLGDLINASSADIEWVSRRQQRKASDKPAPILIGFKATAAGTSARDSWLSQRRKLTEMTNSTITGGSMDSKVYINEDLTKATRELLWNTKRQLHGKCKYIWVANGKILAKKDDGGKTVWVRVESDLGELLKK